MNQNKHMIVNDVVVATDKLKYELLRFPKPEEIAVEANVEVVLLGRFKDSCPLSDTLSSREKVNSIGN